MIRPRPLAPRWEGRAWISRAPRIAGDVRVIDNVSTPRGRPRRRSRAGRRAALRAARSPAGGSSAPPAPPAGVRRALNRPLPCRLEIGISPRMTAMFRIIRICITR